MALKTITRQEVNRQDPVEGRLADVAYLNGMKPDGSPVKITPLNLRVEPGSISEVVAQKVAEVETKVAEVETKLAESTEKLPELLSEYAKKKQLEEGAIIPALAENLNTSDVSVNTTFDGGDDTGEETESDNFVIRSTAGNLSVASGAVKMMELGGNTVKFNQLVETRNVSFFTSLNAISASYNFSNADQAYPLLSKNIFTTAGHKFFLYMHDSGGVFRTATMGDIKYNDKVSISKGASSIFVGTGVSSNIQLTNDDVKNGKGVFTAFCLDLTAMGWDDITTVDEFWARWRNTTGLTAIPPTYTEGQLLSFNPKQLWANGFNQWDEEWEVGTLDTTTGEKANSAFTIRSKNYIPVIGGRLYHINTNGYYPDICFYDSNKNFISGKAYNKDADFETPTNAAFMMFRMANAYGTSYHNDICINLAWSGYRNGEYEPHKEHLANIDVSSIKDTSGNQAFPIGLNKVLDVKDEVLLPQRKAWKRYGVKVFDGTENWSYNINATHPYFGTNIKGKKEYPPSTTNNVTMDSNLYSCVGYMYDNGVAPSSTSDKCFAVNTSTIVRFRDTAYTSLASWKQHLADLKAAGTPLMVVYELATPELLDLPDDFVDTYLCDDFGLEAFVNDEEMIVRPSTATFAYERDLKNQLRNHLDRHAEEWVNRAELPYIEVGTATYAKGLVPRGDATQEEFNGIRKSGGIKDIETGDVAIQSIKGKTLVWNQLVKRNTQTFIHNGITFTIVDGKITASGTATAHALFNIYDSRTASSSLIEGHKYLVYGVKASNTAIVDSYSGLFFDNGYGAVFTHDGRIVTYALRVNSGATVSNVEFDPILIDLTQMFGAGNEPATYEEYLLRKPQVEDEYAYNEGTLVNNTAVGIKTTGRNLFDKNQPQEMLTYVTADGNVTTKKGMIINLPVGRYYAHPGVKSSKTDYYYLYILDSSMKSLRAAVQYFIYPDGATQGEFTIGAGEKLMFVNVDKTTDMNFTDRDIIINLYDPSFNGKYEPYTEHRLTFGESKIEGGLKSAGTAYDERFADREVKRIGSIAFDGSEEWEYDNNWFGTYSHNLQNFKNKIKSGGYIMAIGYPNRTYSASTNKGIGFSANTLCVVDSAYTTASSWKQHLADLKAAGTPLTVYYVLADPEVIEHDTAQNFNYPVDGHGTEEPLYAEGDNEHAPYVAEHVYAPDAFKTIVSNRERIATLEAQYSNLAARVSALEAKPVSLEE